VRILLHHSPHQSWNPRQFKATAQEDEDDPAKVFISPAVSRRVPAWT
jgi:hypothetical protein